jgi:hypothetical protein
VEDAMKQESVRSAKLVKLFSSLFVLVMGMAAIGVLASCSDVPPVTGSSSVEDEGLSIRVNARLSSTPPTTWGVYATTDGNIVLTAPLAKADMGDSEEKVKAFMNKALKRIFAELPEVRSVHVMDKNREDVGVFKAK